MTERVPKTVGNDVIIGGFVELTIMIQQTSQADRFKQQMRDSLVRVTLNSRAIKIVRDGTARPRISLFMQRFRNLGLIETNLDRFLVINEKKLTDYLAQIATAAGHHRGSRGDSCQNRSVLDSNRFRISAS